MRTATAEDRKSATALSPISGLIRKNCARFPGIRRDAELPDAAHVLPNHRRVGFARKRLLEFRHVGNNAIDAVLIRRVRVGERFQALSFGTTVLAPLLRPAEKESLLGVDTID